MPVVVLPILGKQNLYSHAHTQEYSKSTLMLPPLLSSVFFFLFFLTISDHWKMTRSENDRSHAVLSFLFCVKLDVVEHCMCVAGWKAISWQLDARACTFARLRSPCTIFTHYMHSILLSWDGKTRKDAEKQTTQK